MGNGDEKVNNNLYGELMKRSRGKKSLIIVCDEKNVKYGNFLGQLISTNDDKEDGVIGVEDGTVEAAVWTEKEYKANKVHIPFSQHVVFMGKNKISDEETTSIPVLFDNYGMQYGWLGKRAKMLVSNGGLSDQEYKGFVEFCLGYQEKFENAIMRVNYGGMDLKEYARIQDDPQKLNKRINDKRNKDTQKRMKKIGRNMLISFIPVVGPIVGPTAMMVDGVKDVSTAIVNNRFEIIDQQHRALAAIFYIEGLQKFLEG